MKCPLCEEESQQAVDLDRHGHPRPPVIAFHVGDRSRKSAKRLWAKIPEAYRQHGTFYTDQYVV